MTVMTVPVTTRAWDLLASEWTKLRSVRSTYLMLLSAAVAALVIGVFSTATAPVYPVGFFDSVTTSLNGSLVAQFVFGVFGALTITSEHATGMILTTFAAAPRRRAVLAAKAIVTGAVALVVGEVITFAAFFLGQLELSGKHLNVALGDPGVLRAVSGTGFYMCVVTIVGLCLGTIIRHTAGTVAAVGLIFVQPLVMTTVLPDTSSGAGDWVLYWAGQAIMGAGHRPNYPSAEKAFLVCGVYAVVALAAATVVITRRDA
jgi:ABC-type transport system involved in multi-copper enzyme maturation permease subunit